MSTLHWFLINFLIGLRMQIGNKIKFSTQYKEIPDVLLRVVVNNLL